MTRSSNNPSINLKNIEELPPLNLRDPTLFKRGINEWLVSYTPQLNDYPQSDPGLFVAISQVMAMYPEVKETVLSLDSLTEQQKENMKIILEVTKQPDKSLQEAKRIESDESDPEEDFDSEEEKENLADEKAWYTPTKIEQKEEVDHSQPVFFNIFAHGSEEGSTEKRMKKKGPNIIHQLFNACKDDK